ncbi:MAG: DNA polymerase III subunit delta [Fimbriimonadaceae bacterium]
MSHYSLEKALASQIVFLGGSESTLRRRALNELISAGLADDDFDLEVTNGDTGDPTRWIGSAGTSPFLSPRRVVVVRNLYRCQDHQLLGTPELPSSALLILVGDEEMVSDEKERAMASIASGWEKAVSRAKGYSCLFNVTSKAVVETIREEATRMGKQMAPPVAEHLNEMCGGNLSQALDELQKLNLYVSGAAITIRDLEAIVLPSREWNVFKLLDGAMQGDVGSALRQLRILIGSSSKSEGAIHAQILPQVSRQLRLLFQARSILDAGGSQANVPAQAKASMPTKNNLLSEKEYPQKLAFQRARRLNVNQIGEAMTVVADTDARIKGILPGYGNVETMEQMVMQLARILN